MDQLKRIRQRYYSVLANVTAGQLVLTHSPLREKKKEENEEEEEEEKGGG